MQTKITVNTPAEFSIPQETSWHFERTLKPDDKTIDKYVVIQAGASDIVKVLKAYFPHPVVGYNIASIEIIYNESLNRMFYFQAKTMNARKGNPKFTATWKTQTTGAEKEHREATHQSLQKLAEPYGDSSMPNVMILPLWHGTSEEVSEHIFNTGYGIFNSNDPNFVTDQGYFGRGVYTAYEAEYSYRCYAQKHGDKAVLLLNWVCSLEAYPIVDGDRPRAEGKPLGYDNCDAHFIPVHSNQHPNSVIYDACSPNQNPHYREMVVFNSAQCLPRYRVKLIKNTPQPAIDDISTAHYQMGLEVLGVGQYAQVSNVFEEAQDAGHPAARIRLHWLHLGASGVIPANAQKLAKFQTVSKETLAWLKRKASFRCENDQEAQFNLAWCYQQGLGVEINLAKAAQYYWVAATQGHRDAQYQLGVCCASGIGVKKDMDKAIFYYEQAAKQGHVQAHYVLSQCYALGLGVLSDATKAAFHQQAARKGRHPLLIGQSMGSALSSPVTTTMGGGITTTTTTTAMTNTTSIDTATRTKEILQLRNILAQKELQWVQKDTQLIQKESEFKQQIEQTKQQKEKVEQEKIQSDQKIQQLQQQVNQLNQALSAEKQALQSQQQRHVNVEAENQQMKAKVAKLEQTLQIAEDAKLSLEIQLKDRQKSSSSSSSQFSTGNSAFSGVFHPAPSSPSSSSSSSNQNSLSYAEQVEAMSTSAQSKIHADELKALLKWVTEGHLVEVEKLLKKNPTLALGTGTVKDLSDRTFNNITALQYAAWAYDRDVWELIMRYLDAHNASIQLKALAKEPERYSSHGTNYDISPLITKTKTYVDNWIKWSGEQCRNYWQKEVGGEQRKCPAWLIYAWSEEGADVAWTKNDFSQKIKREYEKHRLDWWMTENYNGGRGVGSSWAVVRGADSVVWRDEMGKYDKYKSIHIVRGIKKDRRCQVNVQKVCMESLERLKAGLLRQLGNSSMGFGKGQ
jgi:hypothetical protein